MQPRSGHAKTKANLPLSSRRRRAALFTVRPAYCFQNIIAPQTSRCLPYPRGRALPSRRVAQAINHLPERWVYQKHGAQLRKPASLKSSGLYVPREGSTPANYYNRWRRFNGIARPCLQQALTSSAQKHNGNARLSQARQAKRKVVRK